MIWKCIGCTLFDKEWNEKLSTKNKNKYPRNESETIFYELLLINSWCCSFLSRPVVVWISGAAYQLLQVGNLREFLFPLTGHRQPVLSWVCENGGVDFRCQPNALPFTFPSIGHVTELVEHDHREQPNTTGAYFDVLWLRLKIFLKVHFHHFLKLLHYFTLYLYTEPWYLRWIRVTSLC